VLVRILKYLLAIPLLLIAVIIVWTNTKVLYEPEIITHGSDTIQHEVVKELRGLKQALNRNADIEMQNIYPEGYVFLNAIYTLAWTSFLGDERHHNYFAEGHAEIQKAWTKIASETGRSFFDENLPLPYGAFYNGWSSYVLGSKLRLEQANKRNEQEVYHFRHQCDKIANVIRLTPFPESYYRAAWPADVMLCVASLSIHDKIFEPRYKDIIDNWLRELKKCLDSRGMIPHAVHPETGKTAENARGSSMSLMLIFLRDIDRQFAQDQFILFERNFADYKFGLMGIREYAKGESGEGDVDSGPVILGFGGAATIVGMQTLSLFGQSELSIRVRNGVEAFGVPLQRENFKYYLFGTLPIADAFITWSHSKIQVQRKPVPFTTFHLYSVFILILACTGLWFIFA